MANKRREVAFFDDLKKLSEKIKSLDDIVVIHHYDADGLTSGAILIKALEREGKKVSHLCLKQLYKENIEEIKLLGKNFLFVDFGSGQLDYLIKDFDKNNLFILDHHQPSLINGVIPKLKWHVNPLLYGLDGGKELSGSGLAFFFALALNKKNFDLSALAIVGAVGDMQDFSGKLIGLNRKILEIAVNKKIVSVKNDLRLYGRISRPLISYLVFSSSPIIPEITANEENCLAFLKQNNILLKDPFTEEWLSYEDLSKEDKQKLSSALILHLSEHNVPEWKIQSLIGEVYTIEKELPKSPLRDCKEFGTACNSAGRHAMPEVALQVCLGNRNKDSYYGQLLGLIEEHKRELRKGIEFVKTNGIEEKKSFYFFDAKDVIQDSLVGIIAGMLYGSVINEDKPIIAFARNDDLTIKVSGRGTQTLIRKGLNLGKAFKELEKEIEGVAGGGHGVAAGMKIPIEKVDLVLERLEEILFEQLNNK
jgi:single-stranded-DNA-specific exonuclease